jgi:hypothetical protein
VTCKPLKSTVKEWSWNKNYKPAQRIKVVMLVPLAVVTVKRGQVIVGRKNIRSTKSDSSKFRFMLRMYWARR